MNLEFLYEERDNLIHLIQAIINKLEEEESRAETRDKSAVCWRTYQIQALYDARVELALVNKLIREKEESFEQ